MFFSLQSCALVGLEPHLVICEVDLSPQLPALSLVGLPSSVTQESRERVRAAIVNSGFEWPARKVTISLLPAQLPKWGSHFELAMALTVLGAASSSNHLLLNCLAVGELSLSGEVRPCEWAGAIAGWLVQRILSSRNKPWLILAHDDDIKQLVAAEPRLARLCEMASAATLAEGVDQLTAALQRASSLPSPGPTGHETESSGESSGNSEKRSKRSRFAVLSQVKNEPLGVVASLVAVAGGHHCLFAGPHGMGKSMLVRAICEASEPLNEAVRVRRQVILRTFGFDPDNSTEMGTPRPVIALQTSISRAALEGAVLASGQVLPGEFTRAHLSILVADEFLEFRRDVLESLRQPLDEEIVRLQRAKFRVTLPAKFQLLASTNLCACGHFGKTDPAACRCQSRIRGAYQLKLSGPLLDRFDLVVIIGGRGSGLRPLVVPPDLQQLVDELVDHKTWDARLARCAEQPRPRFDGAATPDPSPASTTFDNFWRTYPQPITDRGKAKILNVAKTVAVLLEQPLGIQHLRLALLIRQDIEVALKPISKKIDGLDRIKTL